MMKSHFLSWLVLAGACCVIRAAAEDPAPIVAEEKTLIWPPERFQADVSADAEDFKIDLKVPTMWMALTQPSKEGKPAPKNWAEMPIPSISLVAKADSPQEIRLTLVPGERDEKSTSRPVKLEGKTVGSLEFPEQGAARFRIPRAVLKPLGDHFHVMIDRALREVHDANSDKINVPPDNNWLSHTVMTTREGRFATYSSLEPLILSAKLRERKPKTYNEALDAFGPAFLSPLAGIGYWEWHFDDGEVHRALGPESKAGNLKSEIEIEKR